MHRNSDRRAEQQVTISSSLLFQTWSFLIVNHLKAILARLRTDARSKKQSDDFPAQIYVNQKSSFDTHEKAMEKVRVQQAAVFRADIKQSAAKNSATGSFHTAKRARTPDPFANARVVSKSMPVAHSRAADSKKNIKLVEHPRQLSVKVSSQRNFPVAATALDKSDRLDVNCKAETPSQIGEVALSPRCSEVVSGEIFKTITPPPVPLDISDGPLLFVVSSSKLSIPLYFKSVNPTSSRAFYVQVTLTFMDLASLLALPVLNAATHRLLRDHGDRCGFAAYNLSH
jgi:hypothetical protein